MNPVAAGANGAVVITQVIPSNIIQVGPSVPQNTLCQVPKALQKFFLGEPKALGVAQILIGFMQIILAIVLVSDVPTRFSISLEVGVPFWGGVCSIISGSLSVAAKNKAKMCLVKGSMGMNIISSIAAVVGIVLLCIDLRVNNNYYYYCSYYSYNGPYYNSSYESCKMFRNALMIITIGIESVLLLLLALELCISISTFAFGCKAVCCKSKSSKSIAILQNEFTPEMNFNLAALPMHNVANQYRPEANSPSEPAETYEEIDQKRPEVNQSAKEVPVYIDTEPCRPQVTPYSLALPTTDNNTKQDP
ncbi:membrane-spanning 4-domains subfamily A member 4A-like [Microcaecilia unicolor]|uniref:Membrane-spanning 4-domains subfamily A member 4A-like n=1 Tax=Microcaecilia unicolor TaxID=1415580 RepID=A0A6P7X6B6_9AMPH|nr:membrane-spanning 4-domains subfamily A member 4A-like [Microcaecilia unicolor]